MGRRSRALLYVPGAEHAGIAIFQCGLGGGGFASYLEWADETLIGVVTDFHVPADTGVTLQELLEGETR